MSLCTVMTTVHVQYEAFFLAQARIYKDVTDYLGTADASLSLRDDGTLFLSLGQSEGPAQESFTPGQHVNLQLRGEVQGKDVVVHASGTYLEPGAYQIFEYRIHTR